MNQPMANLPVVIFQFAMSPYEDWQKLAWAGALLITLSVLTLNILARVLFRQKRDYPIIGSERNDSRCNIESLRQPSDRARPEFLLREDPRAERHQPGHSGKDGDRLHRPVRLRQIHPAAHFQPHVPALSQADAPPGEILLDGENLLDKKQDLNTLRAKIGMVFQKPTPFPMSIYDNIAFGVKLYENLSSHEMDDRVEWALKKAALWNEVKDKLKQSGTGLSGGQQQRLCIARAIAVKPQVLLLDEPTSALDPISTAHIEKLIDELKKDFTIVIVTHNMQQAARVSDFTAYMYLGDLIEFGRYQYGVHQSQAQGNGRLHYRPFRLSDLPRRDNSIGDRQRVATLQINDFGFCFFAFHSPHPPLTRRATQGIPKGWRIGVAFFLVTFSWRSKKK